MGTPCKGHNLLRWHENAKPAWSRLDAKAIIPNLDIRPWWFNPVTPQRAAGCLIEPPVSEPVAKKTSPAATATADPGAYRYFCIGRKSMDFLQRQLVSFVEPIANSSIFGFPKHYHQTKGLCATNYLGIVKW